MRTNNAMQLKAKIKARAKQAGVSPQLLLQDYLLERLLERLSRSRWRERVIVKGGMLIASYMGIDSRVTKGLDTTVRGFDLTHESAEAVFKEIIAVEADDGLVFEFDRTEDIREGDEYPGIRVFLIAKYPPMAVPLSVDVTTGDAITPGPVEYEYPLTFEGYSVPLYTYPLETVLAEKLETVIARGAANTRPRDYYDIHMLWALKRGALDLDMLRKALAATAEKRGSIAALDRYEKTMCSVAESDAMRGLWAKYIRNYSYAADLELAQACETVRKIMATIGW